MRKKSGSRKTPDLIFLLIVLAVLAFGVVMVYDSSVVYASDVFGGKYYFLILQSFWVGLSLAVFLFASRIDYHVLEKHTLIILAISLFFLLILAMYKILPKPILPFYEVFVPPVNGAHRWFYLNPKPLPTLPLLGRIGFQPSEFAKLAIAVYLASLLSSNKRKGLVIRAALVTVIFGSLILIQPDFGTAAILVGVSFLMYFVSGAPLRNLFLIGVVLSVSGLFFIGSSGYRRERLMSYLNPSAGESLSSRYQINQILIALGSGGVSGLGMGRSIQKYGYIPEVSTDSIFAIVGEEFGFLGTSVVVLFLLLLISRSLWIAGRVGDDFGRLLGVGIAGFIGLQVFVNLFSMTHLIPLTGVPLPLISYGGSSLAVNMFALGIILNMSAFSTGKK